MPIRIYRLTSTSTATAVGQATTVIVARGRIKQVVWTAANSGGAAMGRLSSELALNNTANGNAETATGAPSELLVARISQATTTNAATALAFTVPCDVPVMPGNQICINSLQTGTAAATTVVGADVHVLE